MNAKNGNSCDNRDLAVLSLRKLKKSIKKQHREGVEVVDAVIHAIEQGYLDQACNCLDRIQFLELSSVERMLLEHALSMIRCETNYDKLTLDSAIYNRMASYLLKLTVEHSLSFAKAELIGYLTSFLISFQYLHFEQNSYTSVYYLRLRSHAGRV